jgi:elongation factor P
MYNSSDLRKGLKIQIDDEPYLVIDFQFSKPGKGQSLYRCKLRNMITGMIIDRTYRSGDTFEPANLEQRKMQYLYNQDGVFYFMDVQVEILLFDKRPIGITLPNFVDLTVTRADPWVKGDSVSGDSKPVTVETGYALRVPPFIEEGIKITVDTRTGEYVTRVK